MAAVVHQLSGWQTTADLYGYVMQRHACTHKYMKEKELYEAAKWAVDADENLEMQIFCRIGKTVSYNDRIDFYMKEGGVRTWQRQ